MKILLLEDNERFVGLISDALEMEGYEVLWKATVGEAIEVFQGEAFGLVITDIHLKGKTPTSKETGSGLDFVKEVRRNSQVPVIVVTGMELISEEAVLRRKVDAFFYKHGNFDVVKFIDRVKELCPL